MLVTSRVASLAVTASAQGRAREAEALLARGIGLARILDASFYLGECLYHLAKLHAGQERLEEAERLNEPALEIAARSGPRHPPARRTRAPGTDAAIGKLQRLALENQDMAEQAAILDAVWELHPADEEARRAAAEQYRVLYERAPASPTERRTSG